jgi:membrane-bound metal-dependent hydrolase YbcI (DUF457 family)
MALFREHITLGAILAAVGVTLLYFYAIVTDPLLLIILFAATTIGSFLPDLDLDTGIPFYIIFGAFTLATTGWSLYYMLSHEPHTLYLLAAVPFATLLFVWFVLGHMFKRFTRHRGMMHSIPAMCISALSVFLAARYLEQGEPLSLIFALATALGFASHLILDEIHSENVLDGNPFVPKHSLGTALKLFSNSGWVNLFTYLLLISLLYRAFT